MNGVSFFKALPRDVRIRGGCDDCNAYQVLDDSNAPIYLLRVYHDETCPFLRTRREAS